MGRRSRKRTVPRPPAGTTSKRVRGEARDAQVRATLEPLQPGERPAAVTAASIVAVLIGLANIGLYLGGYEVRGGDASALGVGLVAAVMFAAAAGMWRLRYWAVLGFQALLGIAVAFAALSLLVASNLAAVALCFGIILPAGFLFWKLVSAMARIQMPERAPLRRPEEP